jgi:pimeloyl-ACP methyl ester carboxylesterase
MTTFILIHGAFHGGWCWEPVTPYLERRGHRVLTPDLPGHGSDQTPQSDATFSLAVARVAKVAASEPDPVVLVGHSMGGTVISQVAERFPDRVKMLVWIAGFLISTGMSLMDYLTAHEDLGRSEVVPNAIPSADGLSFAFRTGKARELFYNTTPTRLANEATARLRSTARSYLDSPVDLSADRFGRVPRGYVVCLHDRALPLAMQRQMITENPCSKVFELDCDHSPFLSKAAELAECLLKLA